MRSCGFSLKQQNNTSLEDSIVDDSADQRMVLELARIEATRGDQAQKRSRQERGMEATQQAGRVLTTNHSGT